MSDNADRLIKCRLCQKRIDDILGFKIKNTPSIVQNLPKKSAAALNHKITLEVFECDGCGLVQLKNAPVKYYKTVIRAAGISQEMQKFRSKQITSFINENQLDRKAKVIEIGCGGGEYLSLLSARFDQAVGLEYGIKNLETCKSKSLNVLRGYIKDSNYVISIEKFESFFIFNFLEHIPNPRDFLLGLRANLKPGAVGIIEVPNYDFMLAKKIFYDYSPEHLTYFTKRTLKKILELTGFRCIKINVVWHRHILSAEVECLPDVPVNIGIQETLNKLVLKIEGLINKANNVVVWGACHHSFFLLSQLANIKKIQYVVDSAAFKVGRYTPASGLRIYSPEQLKINRPDLLLIMASSYSREVAKSALKNCKDIPKIYMLDENKLVIVK